MADLIKFKRGNAISASAEKITAGEPAFSISEGKLFIGETDAGETISSLNADGKYYIRWDKLNNIPNTKLAGGITNNQLAGGITSAKIGTGEIKPTNIDSNAVTTTKIDNKAVTKAKLNVNGDPNTVAEQTQSQRLDVDAYIWELSQLAAGAGVTATSAQKLTTNAGGVNRPVYFTGGVPTNCNWYGGGTKVTLNGSAKGGKDAQSANEASFYAPTVSGSSNNILKSNGLGSAPSWFDATTSSNTIKWYSAKNADSATTATNANKIRINNNGTNAYYTLKFENGVLQFNS